MSHGLNSAFHGERFFQGELAPCTCRILCVRVKTHKMMHALLHAREIFSKVFYLGHLTNPPNLLQSRSLCKIVGGKNENRDILSQGESRLARQGLCFVACDVHVVFSGDGAGCAVSRCHTVWIRPVMVSSFFGWVYFLFLSHFARSHQNP